MNELIARAERFSQRIAIRDAHGVHTYADLLSASASIAAGLLKGRLTLAERRVAFLIKPSFKHVATQWGIWRAGGLAVPLCADHPLPALSYVLRDAQVDQLILDLPLDNDLHKMAKEYDIDVRPFDDLIIQRPVDLPNTELETRAMMLYTSGTTGSPKGVVTTHANIRAQVTTLVNAWAWDKTDHILNILPLHHVHGIINVLSCALWSGACCEFLDKFSPHEVWRTFQLGFANVFMAVPTVYFKLIHYWEHATKEEQARMSNSLTHFRLMVSGSAALPVSVLEKWKLISGQILLERYGMTEIGMGLSNSYEGKRIPGHVGRPLPGVEIRLANGEGKVVTEGESGEIQVKSNSVFKEYWNRMEATRAAFTDDGWFKTGDIAKINDGYYQILGRDSVDIIKSGGYKISALQIEEVVRKYIGIKDCAVVGVDNEEWGEVVAVAVTSDKKEINFEDLKDWLREQLPSYQVPRKYLEIESLPRNTIGKVTKNQVKKLFQTNES